MITRKSTEIQVTPTLSFPEGTPEEELVDLVTISIELRVPAEELDRDRRNDFQNRIPSAVEALVAELNTPDEGDPI